jgi:hypothetical protein
MPIAEMLSQDRRGSAEGTVEGSGSGALGDDCAGDGDGVAGFVVRVADPPLAVLSRVSAPSATPQPTSAAHRATATAATGHLVTPTRPATASPYVRRPPVGTCSQLR